MTVAVTGIGVLSAFGVGTGRFWDGLVAGTSPLVPSGHDQMLVGRVDGLDLRDVVRTPAGRRIDHASLLALAAARLALADAGLPELFADPSRTGLALGSSLGNLRETPPFLDRLFEKGAGNPLVFPNMVMNASLSYVSIELGVSGPTAMLTEVEVPGEAAIAWGVRLVADGAVDVCLAGAADELADVLFPVLARSGGLTRGVPRPLDRASDGRVLGEGAAVLVLEPGERAAARRARVYAELVPHPGFGVPAPVHGHPTDPSDVARGLAPLVGDADLIVAGASGLPGRDEVEAEAIAGATAGRRVAVTAPRGAIGDFGAAGALGVAAAALALHHGCIPPTVGCRLPARAGVDVVTGGARRADLRVAVVSAVGRGGICRPLRLVKGAAWAT
jgi:3-oxoacyl-(acyl-carrier-protein) synthase